MLHEKLQKQVPAWALVAVAVGMILLFAVGSGLYNSGWSNGLSLGLLAGSGDGGNLLAYQGNALHHGWRIGGFFGGILHLFLFFFVMSMIFRVLGFMRWKMHRAHQMQGEGGKNSGQQPWAGEHSWGGPPWAQHHPHRQQSQQQSEGNVPISPNEKPSEEKPQNTSWVV